MTHFKFLFVILFLVGCSHPAVNQKLSSDWTPLAPGKRLKILRKNTKKRRQYTGLHMSFQAKLTFLNTQLQQDNLKIYSQFQNWDANKALKKEQEFAMGLAKESQFFLSFYAKDNRRNKLHIQASDWKAVLKTNTLEVEGVIKLKDKLSDHSKVLYPDTNLWSRNYKITFPVPTETLENEKFEVRIMGPEGMATFNY